MGPASSALPPPPNTVIEGCSVVEVSHVELRVDDDLSELRDEDDVVELRKCE